MSRVVRFVSLAAEEYADAVLWHESVRPGLGSGFRAAVQGILRLVVERPQVFAVHPATGLRRALMPRFPYVVHFEATADHVIVFAVFHAKRDPGRLSARR